MDEYEKVFEKLEKYQDSNKSYNEHNLKVNNKRFYGLIHTLFIIGSVLFIGAYIVLGYYLGVGIFDFYMGLLIILSIFIVSLFFTILEYYGYGHSDISDKGTFFHEFLVNSVIYIIVLYFVAILCHYLIH